MVMYKFKTPQDFKFCYPEPLKSGSLTVPDQAMTVRDIMKRFAQGTLPPIQNNNLISDENATFDSIPPQDIVGFDMADATAILNDINSRKESNNALIRDLEKTILEREIQSKLEQQAKDAEAKRIKDDKRELFKD